MSRILLAWELGAGLGHLGPFLGLVPQLLKHGHEIHIAAREIFNACKAVRDLPVTVHQAPLCLNTYGGLQEPPLNYAEILMRYGYLDPAMLQAMLAAWCSLLRTTRADVLVADHAPTALLAARLLGLPRAVIGSPFAVPPAVHPTPNMRPWLDVPAARLLDSDVRVLAHINAALPAGALPLTAIHQLFSDVSRFFIGIPETDPYGARESGDYLGLTTPIAGTNAPVWPEGTGKRVFVYLHADYRHLDAVAQALGACGARIFAYVLGADATLRQKLQNYGVTVSPDIVDMRQALAETDVCVAHGTGTTLAAVQAGVPLLMLPMQLENFLFASALQRAGVGIAIHPDDAKLDIGTPLRELLHEDRYAAGARALAARYSEPSVGTITARAVARIEALAAGAQEKTV